MSVRIICKGTRPKYIDQYINWPNVAGAFLPAGTPLAENGTVANDSNATGILTGDARRSDGVQPCRLIVAGQLDLDAVENSIGARLTTACKDALRDIAFVSGLSAPTALPAVTDADNGKILKVVNGVWAAVSP